MSIVSGPKEVTSNLIFYYDMSNTQKSWKGAPTTNLLSEPKTFLGWTKTSSVVITNDTYTDNNNTGIVAFMQTDGQATTVSLSSITWPAANGDTFTVSFYAKKISGVGNDIYIDPDAYDGVNGTGTQVTINPAASIVTVINDGQWHRYSTTFTITGSALSARLYFYHSSAGNRNIDYLVSMPQVELKSYSTPFVAGARSNTQSIIDLTKNSTITANSLTYNSDGNFSFNGSNNAISIPTITPTSGVTFNAWIYIDGANANYGAIFSNWGTGGNAYFINTQNGVSTSIQVYFSGSLRFTITSLPLNTYMMLTITNNGTTAVGYINGIQQASAVSTLISATNISSIGYDISRNSFPFKGNISIAQIYNRFLSSDEILQNFNALRGRFNI